MAKPEATEQPEPANARAPDPVPLGALKAAAEQIESFLKSMGRELELRVDDESGHVVIRVRDTQTGDVIRQIPSEETLRLARTLGNGPHALIDVLI